MSSKASTHCSLVSEAYTIHQTYHHSPLIAYLPVYYPTYTTYRITTHNLPDNRSPQVFHPQYDPPSPFSAFTVVNLPTPGRRHSPRNSPSPVIRPTATLGVDPLVATGTGSYPSSKLHYDLSEGPHAACI